MAPQTRRPFLVLLAFLAVGVLGAGVAWACSPGAETTADRGVGLPGTPVQLRGQGFPAGQPVRIKWAAEGEVRYLASARADEQGSFVKPVTVPADASEGEAVFLTVPADPQYTQRVSFLVGSQSPQPLPGQTGPSNPPANPGTGRPDPTQQRPGARPNLAPPDLGSVGGQRPGIVRGLTDVRPGPGGSAPRDGARPAPRGVSAPVATTAPAGTTSTGQPAFSGSVEPGNKPTAVAPDRAGAAERSGEAPGPSEATASGDLWGGFGSGSTRPSLSDVVAPAGSPSSALTVGIALLALSLVGLIATFGVAELRRRRVLGEGVGERRSD